jgi:hypothetical protein
MHATLDILTYCDAQVALFIWIYGLLGSVTQIRFCQWTSCMENGVFGDNNKSLVGYELLTIYSCLWDFLQDHRIIIHLLGKYSLHLFGIYSQKLENSIVYHAVLWPVSRVSNVLTAVALTCHDLVPDWLLTTNAPFGCLLQGNSAALKLSFQTTESTANGLTYIFN